MEKEKLYHIALDDYEHGVVIRSLRQRQCFCLHLYFICIMKHRRKNRILQW